MSSITFTYITFSTGRPLDGVWHTAVVVYGREYYFGSAGIESCEPGGTLLGKKDGGGGGLVWVGYGIRLILKIPVQNLGQELLGKCMQIQADCHSHSPHFVNGKIRA